MAIRSAAIVAPVLGWSFSVAGRTEAAPPDAGQPASAAVITQSEADEFGKALEAATIAGDFATTNELVDWGEIVDRATETPNLPELAEQRASYKKGAVGALAAKNQFFTALNKAVKAGGRFTFLRAELKGKEPFVQFRLNVANNGGLNYYRLYLIRQSDGNVVAGDIFILIIGERMSETLAHYWLPFAAKTIRENGKGTNASAALDPELVITKNLLELKNQGKFQEALQIYKNAPEPSRRSRANLTLCLLAAQNVSAEEYRAMIEAFREFYPDDPTVNFLLIDGYVLQQKFDEAVGCVDRTMTQLGTDGALLIMRANLLALAKKYPQAMADVRKAIAAEPASADPYSSGVDVALMAQDHAATLEFLTVLEKKFGLQFMDLTQSEPFANFVKSPQFKTWQAAHGEK